MLASSTQVFWRGDFFDEAWQAYQPLQRGDLDGFWHHLPGYSAFVVLIGAPLALLAEPLGAETAALRLTALPGLVALAWLGAHLAAQAPPRARVLVVLLAAAGPLVHLTVDYGHPEDLLAAAAAVGAVLAARAGRITPAALLLVLAVLAKQWAILAVGPALLAAPHGHRRLALVAGGGILAVLAAQWFTVPVARAVMTTTNSFFHPHQVFWPFGLDTPAHLVADGHGVRMAPEWIIPLTRPLIVGVAIPLTLLAWRRRSDPLQLLALLFLLRCLLDPWNNSYYHLPLVLSLLAWEVQARRPWPVVTLAVTALIWLNFEVIADVTTDLPFLTYLAWTLPLAAVLLAYPRPSWLAGPSSAARRPSPSTSTP